VLIYAPEGGLISDSLAQPIGTIIALAEQVRILSKSRFGEYRGSLSNSSMAKISTALAIAMDLPAPEDLALQQE
jgi:mRNA interferase MazF